VSKTLIDREKLIEEMKDYLGCSEESCNGCDNEGICFSKIVYEQEEISLKDKMSEIIEFMSNVDYGGECNCAIDNHFDLFKQYGISKGYWEICQVIEDMVESKGDLNDFLLEYYKSVIKSACNVLETFKEEL
jgi:hypothetical protein